LISITTLALLVTAVAAIASVVGAIFAIWRWDYAKKAYDIQKMQIYLQILMLAESREYWRLPKMTYVGQKKDLNKNVEKEIDYILRELEKVFGNIK